MYISSIKIENYRTFKDVIFLFDSQMNIIVGDNNIGKTNFLNLLKVITSGDKFHYNDFRDLHKAICIFIELSMEDFSLPNTLKIQWEQYPTDVEPTLYDAKTKETIPLSYIHNLFYIDFSLENFVKNIQEDRNFNRIHQAFKQYLSSGEHARVHVQNWLLTIGEETRLPIDSNKAAQEVLDRIYGRNRQEELPVLQLMMAVGCQLIGELFSRKQHKNSLFEETLVEDKEGYKVLPLMVSIDDPEMHLHPYLQRAVLEFLKSILNNEEPFFVELIKSILQIDGLNGQLFVVTHSTDALIDDYRQIIRLHWDSEHHVQAACGAGFKFDGEIEKHLIMHFPEVKEAMYAKCALIVEGETEYGSFPYFAKTLGFNFDYYGICLINARGEHSISKISHLLSSFHIPTVCFYDRDVMEEHDDTSFYTEYICYEMDIVKTCIEQRKQNLLLDVIQQVEANSTHISSSLIKKACQKLCIPKSQYNPRKLENISPRAEKQLCFYYFAWLYGHKGVIIGRSLGLHLGKHEIPTSFKNVILQAISKSIHV
ncbi:MAG: ATP-dependent nuclease [Dialister pneumosintes]